jgi:NADH-quinone oxidoreductase subunit A
MIDTYLPMFITFGIALGLGLAMFSLGHFLGKKNPTPEKMMPFECGNDSIGLRDVKSMSVKFYLTAILFVVFDIEVVFIYPWAPLFKGLGWVGFATMTTFVGALLIALVYCWKKGALEWES